MKRLTISRELSLAAQGDSGDGARKSPIARLQVGITLVRGEPLESVVERASVA